MGFAEIPFLSKQLSRERACSESFSFWYNLPVMMEDPIIDAEVLSETTVEPNAPGKAKKVASDHSKAIAFYGNMSTGLLRFGRGSFFWFFAIGLTFSILYSQNPIIPFLVFLIIGWSMAAFAVICTIIGYAFRHRLIRHMKQDPNFEHYVD